MRQASQRDREDPGDQAVQDNTEQAQPEESHVSVLWVLGHSLAASFLAVGLWAIAFGLDLLVRLLHRTQASLSVIVFVSIMEYVLLAVDLTCFVIYVCRSMVEFWNRLWKK